MKKIYKIISLTILTLAFLGLWLQLVDLGELTHFLERVSLTLLGPIFLLMVLRSLAASYRTKILMIPVGEASVLYFWGLSFLDRITTLLVPLQGGAFLRAYLVKKRFRSSFSTCFAIIFFDLLLGLGVDLIFSLWAILHIGVSTNPIFWALGVGLVVVVVAFHLGGGIHKHLRGVTGWMRKIRYRSCDPRGRQKEKQGQASQLQIKLRFINALSNFKLGLSLISKNRSLLPTAVILSLIIFFLTNLRMYLIFSALGVKIPFMPIVFAGALFGLSGFLPGTPIKIGQYELFGLLIYTYFLNLDKNLVAAAILFSHFLAVSFSLLGGFIASIALGINPTPQQK